MTENRRTPVGVTPAEQEMIRALAEQVVVARLNRAHYVGNTASGRVLVELPREEMTEVEKFYFEMGRKMAAEARRVPE